MWYGSSVTFKLRLAKLTKFVLIVALYEMVGVSSAAVDVKLRVLCLVEVAVEASLCLVEVAVEASLCLVEVAVNVAVKSL